MVRQQQPFGRNHLPRTPCAEDHDGVLQRRMIRGVNIRSRELAPLGLHIGDIHLLKIGQQPHSLVGGRRRGEERREQKHRKFFFIGILSIIYFSLSDPQTAKAPETDMRPPHRTSTDLDHAADRTLGGTPQLFVDHHLGRLVFQTGGDLLERPPSSYTKQLFASARLVVGGRRNETACSGNGAASPRGFPASVTTMNSSTSLRPQ